MAANAADKFTKARQNWSGQLDGSGIADESVDSFGLVSAANLPTDTAVYLSIDRVDANGDETNNKWEIVKGVVSGNIVTSVTRGVEGTAQAHSAGAVVEYLMTASQWNDLYEGLTAEHSQLDGTHTSATVATLKATSAEITTGTEDGKVVTPKGLKDAGIVAPEVTLNGEETLANKTLTSPVVANNDAYKAKLANGTVKGLLGILPGDKVYLARSFYKATSASNTVDFNTTNPKTVLTASDVVVPVASDVIISVMFQATPTLPASQSNRGFRTQIYRDAVSLCEYKNQYPSDVFSGIIQPVCISLIDEAVAADTYDYTVQVAAIGSVDVNLDLSGLQLIVEVCPNI